MDFRNHLLVVRSRTEADPVGALLNLSESHLSPGETFSVTFVPRDMKLTIISIECVIAFDQLEDGSQKLVRRRSLVY